MARKCDGEQDHLGASVCTGPNPQWYTAQQAKDQPEFEAFWCVECVHDAVYQGYIVKESTK